MSEGTSKQEPLTLPKGKEFTHRAHRFPGKFHPPLIKYIIREYGDSCDCIADPMCGSGTVGVEALVNGMDCLCLDLDPLSALMTQAKTSPVDPIKLRETGKQIVGGVDEFPEKTTISEEEAREEVQQNLDGTQFCIPLNFLHWFEPHVAVGYSRLLRSADSILKSRSQDMNVAIMTCLAAMVRQISRADPDPVSGLEVTSVREQELKEGVEFDVSSSFNSVLNRLANGYEEIEKSVEEFGSVEVRQRNAKEFSDICRDMGFQPSLVITSPPYCNAIEYARRHRLEYEWLGLFDEEEVEDHVEHRREVSREFFGSVRPRQETLRNLPKVPHPEIREVTEIVEEENERKANLLRKYFLDAYDWLKEIYEALSENGTFCLIVGPSTSYGNPINTPQYLRDIATDSDSTSLSFVVEEVKPYKLKNNKMQYPTDGETTDVEKLIVFRK
jgi:DNA modification methylase